MSTLRTVTKVSPRQILAEQRFAAEDDAGVRGEQVQQTELLIGQLDVAALDAHAAARQIDLDAVNSDRRARRRPLRRRRPARTRWRGRRSSARARATSSRTPNGLVR